MAQSQTKNITELPYHLSTLSPMELPNQKSFLSNLPVEVLLDNVLPFSAAPDLFRLAQCSKVSAYQLDHDQWTSFRWCAVQLFAELCADETLWKRKVSEDYNFFGQGTARTNGWKLIYKGLFKPRGELDKCTQVDLLTSLSSLLSLQSLCGGKSQKKSQPSPLLTVLCREKSNGRLGLSQIPKSIIQGVPYPVQVRLPGVRVVNIVAGGMWVLFCCKLYDTMP